MKLIALLLVVVGCSDISGVEEWRTRCSLRYFHALTQDSAVEWSTHDTVVNRAVIEFTGTRNSGALRMVNGEWWALVRSSLGSFAQPIVYGSYSGTYGDFDGELRVTVVDQYDRTHWLTLLSFSRSGQSLVGIYEDEQTAIRVGWQCS